MPTKRILIKQAVKEPDLSKLNTFISNTEPDYLPNYSNLNSNDINMLYSRNIIDREKAFKHLVNSDGTLELNWNSQKKDTLLLPIVLYNQSKLTVNNKQPKYTLNSIGVPKIQEKEGENTAKLSFESPKWFYPICMLSSIAWLLVIFIYLFKK